ncbi:MAG: hypothetical protein BAJATHORv1_40169 [Candidatus Thorarchaeota archaeon]|nr:MAG: hypothetical protein BAJATHORv1_40169 [Candidatus Thorarchaeota archaeon]
MDVTRERIEKTLLGIKNRIITLRMTALDKEKFDYHSAIAAIFKENYEIKKRIRIGLRMVDELKPELSEPEIQELIETFWNLDDERSFQSRSAWIRAIKGRKRSLGDETYEERRKRQELLKKRKQKADKIRGFESESKFDEAESIESDEFVSHISAIPAEFGVDAAGYAAVASSVVTRYDGQEVDMDEAAISEEIFVYGNLDLVGNKFVYSLTVKSVSESVLTNITCTIVAYPRDCMKLASEPVRSTSRLDAGGFFSESFIFHPSKDCVEGKIVAVVSFIDAKDNLYTVQVEPYIIRSVCDLLRPVESSTKEFQGIFETLVGGTDDIELGWNADVLLEKAEKVLPAMNFYLVDVERKIVGDQIIGSIRGFALGKYTEKRVAVLISVVGDVDEARSRAQVEVVGDDEAMLPTTMSEIAEKIDAWICMKCGARLNPDQVMELEAGGTLDCRYCSSILTLDLYMRGDKKPKSKIREEPSAIGRSGEMSSLSELTPDNPSVPKTRGKIQYEGIDLDTISGVSVLRGCEIVGNQFHYKVKVKNDSPYVITNVAVTIVGYPEDCLTLPGESAKILSRIEVGGFRSPGFILIPTKDCVRGKIVASVSFIDYKDRVHSVHTKPYVIRSVCDLLTPVEMKTTEFEKTLECLESAEQDFEVSWSPELVFKKTMSMVIHKNFHIVDNRTEVQEGEFTGTIRGSAKGKYTEKEIGIVITVSGKQKGRKALVKVKTMGEDVAMLPTTIEELGEHIDSWDCLRCGCKLSADQVVQLKLQKPIQCSHCGHTMSLELYLG